MYVDPIIAAEDLVLDTFHQELSVTLKLSIYWQDFRLIIRWFSLSNVIFTIFFFSGLTLTLQNGIM